MRLKFLCVFTFSFLLELTATGGYMFQLVDYLRIYFVLYGLLAVIVSCLTLYAGFKIFDVCLNKNVINRVKSWGRRVDDFFYNWIDSAVSAPKTEGNTMSICSLCGNTNFDKPAKCVMPRSWPGQILSNWVCCVEGKNFLENTDAHKRQILRKAALVITEHAAKNISGIEKYTAKFDLPVVELSITFKNNEYLMTFMSVRNGLLTCLIRTPLCVKSIPATYDHGFFMDQLDETLKEIFKS